MPLSFDLSHGRPRRRRLRIGLLAGMLAFVLQILAWAWMPAWVAAANAAHPEQIVICTVEGFKTVTLDAAAGVAVGEKPAPKAGDGGCPLCPVMGGLAMAPPAVAVTPADIGRHGVQALPGSQIAAGWFLSTLQARAPPVLG